MAWLLPESLRDAYNAVGRFGLMIVFGLVFLVPQFNYFLFTSIRSVLAFLDSLVSIGGLW